MNSIAKLHDPTDRESALRIMFLDNWPSHGLFCGQVSLHTFLSVQESMSVKSPEGDYRNIFRRENN